MAPGTGGMVGVVEGLDAKKRQRKGCIDVMRYNHT